MNVNLKPIEEQVVVVVGAASGIGRETALQFARRGARLVAADNDALGLETLESEIRQMGVEILTVQADVASSEEVQAIADRAVSQYGRLDTWVHVAATSIYATALKTTAAEYRRVIEVNLLGQIYGAKAALPVLMAGGGGALIHVSSVEARRALPFHSAYGASKHGIAGFIQALRVELRKDGIPVSVTEVLPSSINTPFFDKSLTKLGVKPMGMPPFYEPSTVAAAILHAAEHPEREIIVGGAGKMLVNSQRLSPALTDAALSAFGFRVQQTDEPRSPESPNDFWGPAERYNRVEGDFGKLTFRHSLSTWLDLHPAVKALGVTGAAVALGALFGRRRSAAPK